jgi:aminoglycoside phosphotransferase (APT) family kinase protein
VTPTRGRQETGGRALFWSRLSVAAADSSIESGLQRMGLLAPGEPVSLKPLAGGVSSDIYLAEATDRRFVVKRALFKLKVKANWEAPLSRNAAEAAWLRSVAGWLPRVAPEVLGEDADLGLFAMSYLPPGDNPVWKADLMAGRIDEAFAAAVGRDLSFIHARSAVAPGVPARFDHVATFVAIRVEPYLLATARVHPNLAADLESIAETTLANGKALMHGDVSPKNILHSSRGPVFLDAECACWGDPAFDLAFCLNHLLLKGARRDAVRAAYRPAFVALAEAYLAGVDWEERNDLAARAARLLPALLLARVDGKSPVEYLDAESERDAVRAFAKPLIARPLADLIAIVDIWTRP